ncbi:fatty acyl-AMP ligase [Mycobacteroides abscessus]|uniref:fatty acyl-AMP ligase n=1 Tax=Mycobacteroides abscessus TaxID=36809 RepID=UPI000C2694BB|nr:fatty acyl-AMP ligase [Mycobacteroides abscessus]
MSRFTDELYANALSSSKGMVTGEPDTPVRHTWKQVHERAKQVAGGLAGAGLGPDDAIGMLVGMPVEIAPAIQAVWMRGASLTMLHQPTPRTDLAVWAEDTLKVVDMIGAKAVIVSAPFDAAAPVLEEKGVIVVHIKDLWDADPIEPLEADEDSVALMQLTSGSTGSPKAVKITHRNLYANAHGMYVASKYKPEIDVMVSWLPLFHDMGMVGFLTVPMFFGAELVKITPMDFMRDVLLWGRLIDKYKGTMTAAPNFAYSLFAKRLRNQAKPGDFDLSTLRFVLSGAEPVDPAVVEDLCDAGKPFGFKPSAMVPAYGMAETALAVSFSEVEASGLVVDEDLNVLPARGVGVIELRGESVTPGYVTMGGFLAAQDENGWYNTGDLGYLTEKGHVVVCGRVKDVIIMAGRNIYPTDIERAAGRVDGVRPGCAVAVRLEAGVDPKNQRETFAVVVESNAFENPDEVRRIEQQVAHEVVAEVDVRPRNVVVLGPGSIPKTPSGKLRRSTSVALVI